MARTKSSEKSSSTKSSTKVVELKSVRGGKQTVAERKLAEFYKSYPHVVDGSVREPSAEDKKALGSRCHGKVCTIKCVDTGELRVINTQDAFQVKRTETAQALFLRARRAERRANKKASKAKRG
jgi:FlaG/FlaF family flagellin (archaellin)